MSSTAAGAFPHDIVITPNGKFAYVPDGSNIWAYEIDPNSGALTPLAASPIGVPQHIAEITVNANGSGIYVLQTGSLIGYAIDPASGALTSVPGVIAIEAPIATPSPQMQIDPSGKFVFVPGGGNQIYAASINATTGALTPVTGSPFNVAIPGVVYNSLGPVTFAIAAVLP
jgi:6-phosphogluconolactonase (cycloisomerase 2 family)